MNDFLVDVPFPERIPNRPKEFAIICIEEPEIGAVHRPGTVILGKGWILANQDLEDIKVYIGDRFAGYATYGGFRPDIAERFPTYPQADQSGFSFAVSPAASVLPVEDLTVVAQTVGGHQSRRVVPLRVAGQPGNPDLPAPSSKRASEPSLWPIRLFLDEARIDERGLLRVRGWVLSVAPLLELRLFLGSTALDLPDLGLPRPDVVLNHPSYPNAATSGFRLVQEVGTEWTGTPVLRVQAACEGGLRRQIMSPVDRRLATRTASVNAGGVHICCDVISVTSRGLVSVSGWAVVESGIVGLTIEFDGASIGAAMIGLARPDVGNRFPRVPSARHSGFSFNGTVSAPPEGEHLLTLRFRGGDGEEREIPLPVHVLPPDQDDIVHSEIVSSGIHFDFDAPVLSGDRARDAIGTTLTIRGWAVSMSGIEHIEVRIDDRSAGHAYYGIRREDIAAAFPEFPDALLCGFGFHLPARLIDEGEHTASVIIRGKDGQTVERSFFIVCEGVDAVAPWETVRSRVGQVEVSHALGILERLRKPTFAVHVWLADISAESLDAARSTLASLERQAYPHWRAILTLPCEAEAYSILERLAPSDPWLAGRLSVSPDLRCLTYEDWRVLVCLLRAGDRLGADALLEFATQSALNPDEDFIYCDDRRENVTTGSPAPFFKPDWSPELLQGFNYVGRAWCARASLLVTAGIGRNDIGTLGDYATVLRLTESATAIGHIPKLLLDASSAVGPDKNDRQALADMVTRSDLAATVVPGQAHGTFRVKRDVAIAGRVSVVIPTIAARGLIERAIDGLRHGTAWPDIEIVCLDNIQEQADLHWKGWLHQNADKVIELAEPFNWSRFNNAGAAAASGDYLLFLNDDVEIVKPDWLEAMLGQAQRPEVGVVGAKLLYPDGKIQHAGMFLTRHGGQHAFRFADSDDPGPFGLAQCERNVIAVTGACMLTRRDVYDAIGGFNEAHAVVNNDVDYCLRARRAGYRVVYTPYATLIHHELVSRAKLVDIYDQEQFRGEWGSLLVKGDPYFNPNLSQDSDHFVPEPEPVETVYAGHPLVANENVHRILALKLDHIGDFVTALPALRRLKQRFAGAELYVLVARASKAIAELAPCIDGVLEFNFFHARSSDGQRSVTEAELEGLRERLRPYRFDIAVDLRMQPETRHVLQYTSAALIAGFEPDNRFPWLNITLQWEGDEQLVPKRAHVSDRLTQLVEAVAIACETERPRLPLTSMADARAYVAGLVGAASIPRDFFAGPVVCVHPGVGSDIRQWPADHFAALVDLLVEDGARVMLIGVGDEEQIAMSVLEKVMQAEAVLSLVGKTSLRDLPHVLRAATLYVGNNSGPKHLAAALGVPTLGVH